MSFLLKYKSDEDNLNLICDDLKFVNWFNIFNTDDLEKVWPNVNKTATTGPSYKKGGGIG